jgi:single-strand DNA-binding protein
MYNRVIMLGNLTRDIELRYLQSGTAVASTAIATNRRFKNQMGEQQEEVCFVDITFFGRTAEIANQYLGRGRKVLIEGRLKLDQWTDQNGNKRSKHSIVVENLQMVDSKNSSEGGYQPQGGGYNSNQRGDSFSQSSGGGSYNSPAQSQPAQPMSGGFEQPSSNYQPQQKSEHKIPEIDVDDIDDEIPF